MGGGGGHYNWESCFVFQAPGVQGDMEIYNIIGLALVFRQVTLNHLFIYLFGEPRLSTWYSGLSILDNHRQVIFIEVLNWKAHYTQTKFIILS